MSATDPIDDTAIIANLQAATPDVPAPVQDDPLQHVPDDVLMNLRAVEVGLPQAQEELDTSTTIAAEAYTLRQRGTIHALEAATLATLVPAVIGTPDEPLAYTTVSTSVGVSKAVEILESEAASSKARAITKALASIDKVLTQNGFHTSKIEAEWASELANYQASVAQVTAVRGRVPDQDPNAYIGNTPAPDLLFAEIDPDNDGADFTPHFGDFHKAVKEVNHFTCRFKYFMDCDALFTNGYAYYASDLLKGETIQKAITVRGDVFMYVKIFGDASLRYGNAMQRLRDINAKLVERLRTAATQLTEYQGNNADTSLVAHSISDALMVTNLLSEANKYQDMILRLTQACTTFYTACAQSGIVQSAVENHNVHSMRKAHRIFDK